MNRRGKSRQPLGVCIRTHPTVTTRKIGIVAPPSNLIKTVAALPTSYRTCVIHEPRAFGGVVCTPWILQSGQVHMTHRSHQTRLNQHRGMFRGVEPSFIWRSTVQRASISCFYFTTVFFSILQQLKRRFCVVWVWWTTHRFSGWYVGFELWTSRLVTSVETTIFKSRVGNNLDKSSDLRINLNLDGVPISSKSHTHPSHSQTSCLLTGWHDCGPGQQPHNTLLRRGDRDMLQPSDLTKEKKKRKIFQLFFFLFVRRTISQTISTGGRVQLKLHLVWYYDIMETKMWRDKVLCRVYSIL